MSGDEVGPLLHLSDVARARFRRVCRAWLAVSLLAPLFCLGVLLHGDTAALALVVPIALGGVAWAGWTYRWVRQGRITAAATAAACCGLGAAWSLLLVPVSGDRLSLLISVMGVIALTYAFLHGRRLLAMLVACGVTGLAVVALPAINPLGVVAPPWLAGGVQGSVLFHGLVMLLYTLADYRRRWSESLRTQQVATRDMRAALEARTRFLTAADRALRAPLQALAQELADTSTPERWRLLATRGHDLALTVDTLLDAGPARAAAPGRGPPPGSEPLPHASAGMLYVSPEERERAHADCVRGTWLGAACAPLLAYMQIVGDEVGLRQGFILGTWHMVQMTAALRGTSRGDVSRSALVLSFSSLMTQAALLVFPLVTSRVPMVLGTVASTLVGYAYLNRRQLRLLLVAGAAVLAALCLTPPGFNPFGVQISPHVAPLLFWALSLHGASASLVLLTMYRRRCAAIYAEEQRACEALRRTLASRDSFVRVCSHELRTPVTALQIQLEMGARRADRAPARAAPDPALARARASLERMAGLLDSARDAAQVWGGRLRLACAPVDLVPLVREVAARTTLPGRPACIAVQAGPQSLIGYWDADRLRAVMGLLLHNGLKYGSGKPLEVRLAQTADEARVEVKDHGIGIREAEQAHIFEIFERAVSDSNYGGLGLGLWMSREIVAAHGGHISLQSREGEGSTFCVHLPLRRPATVREADVHAPAPAWPQLQPGGY
jgi:signal transduction histidine kinase